MENRNDHISEEHFEEILRVIRAFKYQKFQEKCKELGLDENSFEATLMRFDGDEGLARLYLDFKEDVDEEIKRDEEFRSHIKIKTKELVNNIKDKREKRKKGLVVLQIISAAASIIIVFTLGLYYLSDHPETQEGTIAQDRTNQQETQEDSAKLAVVESNTSTSTTATAKSEKVIIDEPEPKKDFAVNEKEEPESESRQREISQDVLDKLESTKDKVNSNEKTEDFDKELITYYSTDDINFRSPVDTNKIDMIWKYIAEETLKLNILYHMYEIRFSISEDRNTLNSTEVDIKKDNKAFSFVWEISKLKNGVQVKKIVKKQNKKDYIEYHNQQYEEEIDEILRIIITFES